MRNHGVKLHLSNTIFLPPCQQSVCGSWGRAVSGTRVEGGLGKGECPRAAAAAAATAATAATATVPVSAGELSASLPDTQPLRAAGRRALGSAGA